MDFEDIVCAVAFGVYIIFRILCDKRKQTLESDQKSEPSYHPNVGNVRRRTKATQRRSNTNAQLSRSHGSPSDIPHSSVKRNFSAYKHLPEQTAIKENIPDATVCLAEPKAPVIRKPVNYVQEEVADKKTKLREWIMGQVILGAPAFRKNCENFLNR